MLYLLKKKRPRVVFPPAQEERQPKFIGKRNVSKVNNETLFGLLHQVLCS